jgi:beta-lactamase regulating signal transducer with metallopeptidase domain/xanthosine utilization system XapX-like protein
MNAIGAGLVWTGVQVTLLVLAGGVVYAVLRRRSPAAGSLAALALLVIAIGFSLLAVSPWPNWWRLSVVSANAAEQVANDAKAPDSPASSAKTDGGNTRELAASGTQPIATESFDAVTWARTFWKNVVDGLNEPTRSDAPTAWRWPSFAAWLLIVGVGLGLARLAIGLFAVERYRRRTTPVNDGPLLTLLEATCERLECARRIELRESPEIVSPATVGWRRPFILLPFEWREWSEGERRAVLAHEVAHVARGDFAGWLAAQVSVALYFYNPLVHWLARQLRLEQELAADACGAVAAGGSGAYLTTLAGMALRQDNRKPTWGARPFLPVRGTLLRRIEMLRDRKPISTFTFSTPKRIALWSTLAALGLVIAGLRGPGAATAQAAPGDGELGVQGAADAKPIDLTYVPGDAAMVVAVRPGDVMKTAAAKLVWQAVPDSEPMKIERTLGLPIADIEYVKFIMGDFPSNGHNPFPRIVLRAAKPHDWSKFAATIVSDPVPVDLLGGKKYFKPAKPVDAGPGGFNPPPFCYFAPDDRTVIFATEQEMPILFAASVNPGPDPKWAPTWQRASTGGLAVMLNVENLRRHIEPLKPASGGPDAAIMSMMAPLWQDANRLFVGTDIADKKLGLLALAECPSEKAAGRVQRTTQALITFALNGLVMADKMDTHGPAEMVQIKKTLLGAADELLKQAKVSRDGSTVVVKSEGSGATVLAVASIALPAIQKSRESASRIQSMNNMKQIALAMLNFEIATRRFPAQAFGRPNGDTPRLSWRVRILPHLGEVDLYKQFHFDEPWDSEHNKTLISKMPDVFRSPPDERPTTSASYYVLTGPKTMFSGKDGMKISDITGGASNTIMFVEAKRDIPWTKPEDIDYDPAKPLPKLGGHFPGGFVTAFVDGSVRWIADQTPADVIRALIDPTGDKWNTDLNGPQATSTLTPQGEQPADPTKSR